MSDKWLRFMRKIFGEGRGGGPAASIFSSVVCGLLLAATILSCDRLPPASRYQEAAEKIRAAGLTSEGAFEFLRRITEGGPRLTGSPEAAAAVALSAKMMSESGLENVQTEPVTVNRWVRGPKEEAGIVGSDSLGPAALSICALGGSVGTPGPGLTAPVLEVKSLEELDRLGEAARGKIVFFNRPMDRSRTDAFAAYGGAADQRVDGASAAARHGGLAALVRSLTFRLDDFPHTGLMTYPAGVPRIPAAAISTLDAEMLSALLKKEGAANVYIKMDCGDRGPVESANVMGEITGSDFPKEVILLGGHLDSWDLGTGAHDDGAGCAASLEALRLIKELGLIPRRTIRVVFFMDEEFGGTGGRFYARASRRKDERHLLAMESDRGGFLPVAIAAGGPGSRALRRLRACSKLFEPLGIARFVPGGGGVDVGPLIEQGAVPAAVILDANRYFDFHHSALDILSNVHPRELELQAVILAIMATIFAEEGI